MNIVTLALVLALAAQTDTQPAASEGVVDDPGAPAAAASPGAESEEAGSEPSASDDPAYEEAPAEGASGASVTDGEVAHDDGDAAAEVAPWAATSPATATDEPESAEPDASPPAPVADEPPADVDEAPAHRRRALRVAVYELDASEVDPRLARVVTESLLVELRKLQQVSVISMDEVRAMLDAEATRTAMGCDDDTSCLTEIADALGADVLIVGSMTRIDDQHIFGLKRIDQSEARVDHSVNERMVAEDGEEFLAAVGPAVEKLFPGVPLREGETRGVAEQLFVRLNPPPVPTWAFYSAAAATAGLAAITALVGVADVSLWTSFLIQAQGATVAKTDWAGLGTQQLAVNVLGGATVVGLLATLAAGATTGGMALFVDWNGYGEGSHE